MKNYFSPSIVVIISLLFGAISQASFGQERSSVKTVSAVSTKPAAKQQQAKKIEYAIAIHGGAGSEAKRYSKASNDRRRASLNAALTTGNNILKRGGSALDAVEQVVRFLEDDPQFNAGRGSVFNAAGSHELDASIMDGKTKKCGAVSRVSRVKNPISLARLVMQNSKHIMFSGNGAEQFAMNMRVPMVDPSHFDTPGTRQSWERSRLMRQNGQLDKLPTILDEHTGSYQGTVGCVALDRNGNLAAATSTGGLSNKSFGRIGDSPIIGAGTFAENATCAVSSTGIGEQYMRNVVAYDVAAQMKYGGKTLEQAVDHNLNERLNKGDGGLLAVDKDGNIVMKFNTGGMARAAADSTGRFDILWGVPSK